MTEQQLGKTLGIGITLIMSWCILVALTILTLGGRYGPTHDDGNGGDNLGGRSGRGSD